MDVKQLNTKIGDMTTEELIEAKAFIDNQIDELKFKSRSLETIIADKKNLDEYADKTINNIGD